MTNSARAQRGLPRLSVASDLTAAAARQAAWMARNHRMAHTSGLGSKVCCWQSIGENVAEGPDAGTIHRMFMGSSPHRANILSQRFTQIGVGAARGSNGTLYVSEVFRLPSGATPPRLVSTPQRSTPRASRSAVRTPLAHRVPVAAAPSAAALLARRVARLPAPVKLDPLARGRSWATSMRAMSSG